MRLVKVLDKVNQIEKSKFLSILDQLSSDNRNSNSKLKEFLNNQECQLKQAENEDIAELFGLVSKEFNNYIANGLAYNDSQFDIFFDILIRDGNAIMNRDWLKSLYEKEIKQLKSNLKEFKTLMNEGSSELSDSRKRDYQIFQACVIKAYCNDDDNNQDRKVTKDENSILLTLASSLELSSDETRMIWYSSLPFEELDIDDAIADLRELGVVLFSKKNNTLYVPDEIVRMLRKLRGKEISDKYFRRILRQLKDPEINRVARQHNIDWKLERGDKIAKIIRNGIAVRGVLSNDIFKPEVLVSERKSYLQDLLTKRLDVDLKRVGVTLDERIDKIVEYYNELEVKGEKLLSKAGYHSLLEDVRTVFPELPDMIKREFELQYKEHEILDVNILSQYGIEPYDILDLLTNDQVKHYKELRNITSRGNARRVIIERFVSAADVFLENYELIANRDIAGLKEKGAVIKESDMGMKFEEVTKQLFESLGFEVSEELKKSINSTKDKADIILKISENEVFIVECKTAKETSYSKYSAVSRQLKSYEKLCDKRGIRVLQTMVIAPEFSDGFVDECEYDAELNTSLLSARGLMSLSKSFKKSKLDEFPMRLFMKGGKLNYERIEQALN